MEEGGNEAINMGEVYGLRNLIPLKVYHTEMEWYDTGNTTSLKRARKVFQKKVSPNILHKEKESIWFVGENVIKFSNDEYFIKNRVKRSKSSLIFVLRSLITKNMYSYKLVKGQIISELITIPIFEKLLNHSKSFWKPVFLTKNEKNV